MQRLTRYSQPLAYHHYGDSAQPAILLLHGLGADYRMFQPQIDSLVQAGFYIIIPDLPGHGASQSQVFSFKESCQVLWCLLDDLNIEQVSAVGVSMGGLIAQQIACDNPHRIHKLVLVDSFSSSRSAIAFLQKWLGWLVTWFPKSWQGYLVETTYRRLGHPHVGAYFKQQIQAMSPQQLRYLRTQINTFDIEEPIAHLTMPTLVLVGDQFGQFAIDLAHRTATIIPQAHFQILKGGGDPSNLLVPEQFNAALLEFFSGLPE